MDFRHHQEVAARRAGCEVAPQLAGVGGLAHQVQFIVQVVVEFRNHVARAQAFAVGPQPLDQACCDAHQVEVTFNHAEHVGTQHLDGDLAAIVQDRKMHLRDRRGGDRIVVKRPEQQVRRFAERPLDLPRREIGVERRYPVL